MKTLVVYYSYSYNSKKLVESLKSRADVDVYEVRELDRNETKNAFKFLHNAFKTITNTEVELQECNLNLNDYDLVIYVAGVWAGNLPAPLKSFINKYKLINSDYAYCYSHEGGPGKYETHFEKLMTGNNLVGKLGLISVKKQYDEAEVEFNSWYDGLVK